MNEIDRHLETAHQAILGGDPAAAENEIAALERAFAANPPTGEEARHYRAQVGRLAMLSVAAAEGAAAAHRWLHDTLKLASSLEVYTAAGRRSVDVFPTRNTDRY